MKNIIIFDQNISASKAYGIGTFIKALKYFFRTTDFNVYLIELFSNNNELEIIELHSHIKICIPNGIDGVVDILSLYIDEVNESAIFFSYAAHFKAAKHFKEKYADIQILGIVHAFQWIWITKGRDNRLNRFNVSNNEELQIEQLINISKNEMQYFDKIVALSNDSLRVLKKIYGIDKNKLSLIPNGLKDNLKHNTSKCILKNELSINQNEKIILYAGRLDKLKGVDTLVLAFNRLVSDYSNCRLVFVGDGEFSTVLNTLGKAAIKITFTGRISQKELYKWYSIADIGILPSLSEECSFVGIEMLMHGLPIVATNARGVRDMFHNMENSLTVNCRERKSVFERELYEAMLRLLVDEELTNRLRKKARQWYLDHYQFKLMNQRYLALVDELTYNQS